MTDANPLPADADVMLKNWIDDPEVSAFLQASNWKEAFARYKYLDIAEPPHFAPFTKALSDATLAIITSGGLYVEGEQMPFDAANVYGDPSIRLFPVDIPHERLRIAHDHYDHTVPLQDPRTINPAAHLIALRDEGFIGGLFPQQISFSGYIPDWRRVTDRLVPAVLDQLRGQPIDAVLLVPV
jgi:hypothetical protein